MKFIRKIIAIVFSVVIIFSFFAIPVSAEDSEIDVLLDDFWQILPDAGVVIEDGESLIEGVGFDALISEIFSAVSGGGAVVSFFSMLAGLSLGFVALEAASSKSSELQSSSTAAVSVISSTLIFSSLIPQIVSVSDSLDKLSSFFSRVIPIASGIIAAGGAVSTASVQAVNMNIALSIIERVSTELLIPLVFLMFSLSLVSSVDTDDITSPLARGTRSLFFSLIGIVTAVLLASFSLQSIITSAGDSAALRAAKYAAGNSIPIVGSAVSAALGALFASASYAGASVGVGSVAVIISICLSPLVMLLAYRLALSVFSSALDMLSAPAGARLFSSFRSALDALIAIYASSVIIYLFEVIVFMKCGSFALG